MKQIKSKKGAAMVEFAIIATVLIPITLYTSFFTELLHFRNKVDEMNYFAAWEITAYNLSDYTGGERSSFAKKGAHQEASDLMTTALTKIKNRTAARYKSLDSADNVNSNSSFMMLGPNGTDFALDLTGMKHESMNSLYSKEESHVSSESGHNDSGFSLQSVTEFLDKGMNAITGDWFKFNTRRVGVTSTASATYNVTNRTVAGNNNFRENRGMFAESTMFTESTMDGSATTYTSAPFTVVSDTWALNDGRDIRPTPHFSTEGSGEQYGYRSQVQRMYILGIVNQANSLKSSIPGSSGVSGVMSKVGRFLGINMCTGSFEPFNLLGGFDPFCAKVASINYDENYLSGVSEDASAITPSGVLFKNVDRGQVGHETTPLFYARNGDNFHDSGESKIPDYARTLKKRKNNYMGHPSAECHYTGSKDGDNVKCE